jgi:hypothetical protein
MSAFSANGKKECFAAYVLLHLSSNKSNNYILTISQQGAIKCLSVNISGK